MRFSLCIPTYEMHGQGNEFLLRVLASTGKQSFKDYEIVISDNSQNEEIQNLCKDFNVRYFKNLEKIGLYANTQFAIEQAQGELVKILYQDDCFAHPEALQVISDNFTDKDNWLITACSNNLKPYYSRNNTLGSPSVLTIRKDCPVKFDGSFNWVGDLDFYKQMYEKFGEPKILYDVNVIMGIGQHQTTNHLTNEQKREEENRSS